MREGHDSYGLVALVLDDKLSAGLNHARHRHVYGRIARTGPHHSFVDIGSQNLIGSCWWLPAGVDEHLKAGREHIGRDVYVDFYFGFGCHPDLAGPRASALTWPTDPHAEAFAPATLALIFISRGRRVCARSVVRFKRRRGQCGGAPKRFKDCGPTEHRWRHSWQPFAFQMRPRSGTRQIAFATCNASPADKGRLLLVAREPSRKQTTATTRLLASRIE